MPVYSNVSLGIAPHALYLAAILATRLRLVRLFVRLLMCLLADIPAAIGGHIHYYADDYKPLCQMNPFAFPTHMGGLCHPPLHALYHHAIINQSLNSLDNSSNSFL